MLPEPQTPLFALYVDVRVVLLLVLSDVAADPRVVNDRDCEMLVEYYWRYWERPYSIWDAWHGHAVSICALRHITNYMKRAITVCVVFRPLQVVGRIARRAMCEVTCAG